MKLIEVIADSGHLDTLAGLAEQHELLDFWYVPADDGQRQSFRMLVNDETRQPILDTLQGMLGSSGNGHIVVMPVEAVLPRPEKNDKENNNKKTASKSTREELYNQIEKGARLDFSFLVLTFLSTIVAAIGLLENNVAVIVGAMVIAPLLGPNIALAFATTLGDRDLIFSSLKTSIAGLLLALVLSMIIGWLSPADPGIEILSRTDVGYDGIALALASGAAAALSLTSGIASALVGVMVAVALLPPTATLGMMMVMGHYDLAMGAALLLAINVVSVNLSASLVFVLKGIRPRTWLEKKKARQSATWIVLFWTAMLLLLLFTVFVRSLVEVKPPL
ncbi:MAG: TIGR00341 family protein [Pseudomonadota bacterium]|nr:TIGR00341 family protein [Pseudomonadota bacterium]